MRFPRTFYLAFLSSILTWSPLGAAFDPSVASLTPFRPGDLPDSLVGWWKLDEVSNNRVDSSGRGNNLADNNTVASGVEDYWGSGERSADFERANSENLSIADGNQSSLSLTSSYTIAGWIKIETGADAMTIVSKRDVSPGYELRYRTASGGSLQIVHDSTVSSGAGANPIPTGKWTHIAVIYDDATDLIAFFVDGNLRYTETFTVSPGDTTSPFIIGNHDSASEFFDGLMKDVAIWDAPLSPIQIKSLALGVDLQNRAIRPSSLPSGLVSYWKLDEISPGAISVDRADSGPGGNDLTDATTVPGDSGGFIDGVSARFPHVVHGSVGHYLKRPNAQISSSLKLDGEEQGITVAFWVNPTSLDSSDGLVKFLDSGLNGIFVTLQSAGSFEVSVGRGGVLASNVHSEPGSAPLNTWIHVSAVYDPGLNQIRIFVNGRLSGTGDHAGGIDTSQADFFAGSNGEASGSDYMSGRLSDLAVWNRALTSIEIQVLATGLPLQQSGIVSYWKMDESAGTRMDSIGENHLTDNNTVGANIGVAKLGADFEADNVEALSIADIDQVGLNPNRDFSLSLWFKPETVAQSDYLVDKAMGSTGGYGLRMADGNLLRFQVDVPEVNSTTVPSVGMWSHAVGLASGATLELWFNGVQEGILSSSALPTGHSESFKLGRDQSNAGYYDGLIDEVIVAKRWFREEEIKTIYNHGLAGLSATSSHFPAALNLAVHGAGNVTANPVQADYQPGQTVTLTATAGRFYTFNRWSDGVTTNPRTITVGVDNNFTALFAKTALLEWQVEQVWDRSFGGDVQDVHSFSTPTSDGGFIMGGYSLSGATGNKSASDFGDYDYWAVKVDAQGNRQWDRVFGGTFFEQLNVVRETPDGGFIFGGHSSSENTGNKTTTMNGPGSDAWIVKVDPHGNKQWEQNYGGSGSDQIRRALVPTSDGGYVVGGYSDSGANGNKTSANSGLNDYWVFKIDNQGNKQWDVSFGGNDQDWLRSIQQTRDGGFIVGGISRSGVNGNKSSLNYGGFDYWVIKLDSSGNKQWEKTFGGTADENNGTVIQTSDGGYLVGGGSLSGVTGNKTTTNFGSIDYWILKLDPSGEVVWEQRYGGNTEDTATDLIETPSGFLVAGHSRSGVSGNKTTGNIGGTASTDFWILNLDRDGNMVWERSYGGVANEEFPIIHQLKDGIFVSGTSASGVSGTKTGLGFGVQDYWALRLSAVEVPIGAPLVLVNGQSGIDNTFTFFDTSSVPVTLQTTLPSGTIRYTLDGTTPTASSTLYAGPFNVTGTSTLRAIAFSSDGSQSAVADPVEIKLSEFQILKQWERTDGGTSNDWSSSAVLLPDGGVLVAGISASGIDGNKTSGTFGSFDYWLVRRDADGNKLWEKVFGGHGSEFFPLIQVTADGGFVLVGFSQSQGGGNWTSSTYGGFDVWMVRVDSNGDEVWQQSYGGSADEGTGPGWGIGAKVLPDGGIIFCVDSSSGVSGTKTSAGHGGTDIWVVRTDVNGNLLWDKSYGGTANDSAWAIEATSDGGFLVGGWSDSGQDGNKTSPSHGGRDFWVLKLDANGIKLWEQAYGGSGTDELKTAIATGDGGFVLAGYSKSAVSGNKTAPSYGGTFGDFWVVGISDAGIKLWDTVLGGSRNEIAETLTTLSSGEIVVGGWSDSFPSGNKTSPNIGVEDLWVVVLDSKGNKIGEQTFGGSGPEYLRNLDSLPDGRLLLGASSLSPVSGNKSSTSFGGADYWTLMTSARVVSVGTPSVLVNGQFSPDNSFTFFDIISVPVTLETTFPSGTIRYTLDGSTPTASSTLYTGSFNVTGTSTLRAIAFSSDGSQSVLAEPVQITFAEYHVVKVWERLYGGSSVDSLSSLRKNDDGGFIVAGTSESEPSGNKTSPSFGGNDWWVLRLDSEGNKIWEKGFGGSGDDRIESRGLAQTQDGGFLVLGFSTSPADGNKASPNNSENADGWALRLDANGNKVWDKIYGGTNTDVLVNVRSLADGGFVLLGFSNSNDGNKTSPNHGLYDYWLIRINANGSIIWDKSFGGSDHDIFGKDNLEVTTDGGFIIGGYSYSSASSGNKTSAQFGNGDYWIVRTDGEGNMSWDRSFGGTGEDVPSGLRQTSDGGFVVTGWSDSSTGTGNRTTQVEVVGDFWIVRISSTGDKLWERSFASGDRTIPFIVEEMPDGGFVVTGDGFSVFRLDADGNKMWEQSFNPGNRFHRSSAIVPVGNNEFVIGGSSSATAAGPKTLPGFGGQDFWLIKVKALEVPRGTPQIHVAGDSRADSTFSFSGIFSVPVTLETTFANGTIRYTLDGSTPTASSTLYAGPFNVTGTSTLRAIAFSSDGLQSALADPVEISLSEVRVLKEWDVAFGGTGSDSASGLALTSDGGYLLGGWSVSTDGNKTTPNFGSPDYWVLKLDSTGRKVWEKNFGGSGTDFCLTVAPSTTGGYFALGYSDSGADGNKTTAGFGFKDVWILKVDVDGTVLWQKSYGGDKADEARVIVSTPDGGCLIGAYSWSGVSGNKTTSAFGEGDYWLIKLDANGDKEWEQVFGGTGREELGAATLTSDGGYLVSGFSDSGVTGNKTSANRGGEDFWVIKVDSLGNKQWEQTYGGTGNDVAATVHQTSDGGYIMGGSSDSAVSGNKTDGTFGLADYWVVRIDSVGNILWQQVYGGAGADYLTELAIQPNGNFLIGGISSSGTDGNKQSTGFGFQDFWVLQVDSLGGKKAENVFGGSAADLAYNLKLTPDGGGVLVGSSGSPSGVAKAAPLLGGSDYWLVKTLNVAQSAGAPVVLVNGDFSQDNAFSFLDTASVPVTLETTYPNGTIRYTLDGSTPTASSTLYAGPFNVTQTSTLRAIAFSSDGSLSTVADPVTIAMGVKLNPGDIIVADWRAYQPAGSGLGRIVKVDPISGAQTEIASGGFIVNLSSVTLDAAGNIIVTDSGAARVLRVDPATRLQTVVSSGNLIVNPVGVAVDISGDIIVSDWEGGIIRVDPSTGFQTVIASGDLIVHPRGLVIDSSGDIIVAETSIPGLIKVDPATGSQTIISSGDLFSSSFWGIAIDTDGKILVADGDAFGGPGGVIRVGPVTGTQTEVSSVGQFWNPAGIAVDASGGILVSDWSAFPAPGGLGGVVKVDPVTGSQTVISSQGLFNDPVGLTIVPEPVIGGSLTFDSPVQGTLKDVDGLGIGFTHRLPGSGAILMENDANLSLSTHSGRLAIRSTRSDIQSGIIDNLEVPGVLLTDVQGKDISISALFRNVTIPDGPAGLAIYLGTSTSVNLRAGVHHNNHYILTLFNGAGDQNTFTDPGAFASGDDLLLKFRRRNGLWQLSWINLTNPQVSGELEPTSVPWLDDATELYVGVYASNAGHPNTFLAELDSFSYVVGSESVHAVGIVTQPQSQTVQLGGSANLSVSAVNSDSTLPLYYQWQKDGEDIPGAVGSTLLIENMRPVDIGDYKVRIIRGGDVLISETALVSIEGLDPAIWKGIVAYYPFNGNANDESGNGHHGEAVNTFTIEDRFGGETFGFDVNSTVNIGDAFGLGGLNESWSYGCWFKSSSSNLGRTSYLITDASFDGVVDTVYSAWLTIWENGNLNDRIRSGVGDQSVDHSVNVYDQSWHHAFVSFDRNTGHHNLYLDGLLVDQKPFNASLNYEDIPNWRINLRASNVGFEGAIDDVRFYDRSLSDVEVKALYDSERLPPGVTAPVIAAHPESRTIVEGGNTTFSVDLLNAGSYNYQWQFNGVDIQSATESVLNISTVSLHFGGGYRVVVSNSVGSVMSNVGTLSVDPLPTNTVFLKEGLVAYYPFNGNADDESGNGKDGTLLGVTIGTSRFGVPNQSAIFNGDGAYVMLPEISTQLGQPNTSFTISLWVKPGAKESNHMIAATTDNSYQFGRIHSRADFKVGIYHRLGDQNNEPVGVIQLDPQEWNSIIYITDGSVGIGKVYVNGVRDSNLDFNYSENINYFQENRNWALGTTLNTTCGGCNPYYQGEMDDVRIYNRALSEAEIVALHNHESVPQKNTDRHVIDLTGSTETWRVVPFTGPGQFDYPTDTQSGAADLDLVGDANHPVLYTQLDNKGTSDISDDELAFRIRIGNPKSQTDYSGRTLIGIDANLDGGIDLFFGYDGTGITADDGVKIYAPGSGTNNSPSVTSITDPSSGTFFFPKSSSNFGVVSVNATSDPAGASASLINAPGGATVTDLDGGGINDLFVSFVVSVADLASQMSSVSGITLTPDTPMQYVLITMTQNNSINGDVAGINGGGDTTSTFVELGVMSPVLTVANLPPRISSIANQNTSPGTPSAAIPFTISDPEIDAGSLNISANSSNSTLLPSANLVFGGSGGNRTLELRPVAAFTGEAVVTVTVSDGVLSATTTFTTTVQVASAPTVSIIAPGIGAKFVLPATVFIDVFASDSDGTIAKVEFFEGANKLGEALSAPYRFTWTDPTAGSYELTAKASDDSGNTTTSAAVQISVIPNTVPTISTITDQGTSEDVSTGAIAFIVGDGETAAGDLILSAASSNEGLVPNNNIELGGAGANRTVSLLPALNAAGTTEITLTVTDGVLAETESFVLTVAAVNDPPSISNIPDQTITEDGASEPVPFTIGDVDTPLANLTVTASSSNTLLVPNENIQFGGSGASRTVTIVPTVNQSGAAVITVNVSDGVLTRSEVFVLAVTGVNDLPNISSINDQIVDEDTATTGIAFTVGDAETAADSLTVIGGTSNPDLVPNSGIVIDGTGANRTVTVHPAADRFGLASISISVSDGSLITSESFLLTVNAVNDAPTISNIPDQTRGEDVGTGALQFSVGDVETLADDLAVTGTSSNLGLVPDANILISGKGIDRAVEVTPAQNQTGSAIITLRVTDGVASATEEFFVTFSQLNDLPVISPIPDQATVEDVVAPVVNFTVGDEETPLDSLVLSANSSNHELVPVGNIVFGGTGADRTVTVNPVANQFGTATLTITVSDTDGGTQSEAFVLSVGSVNDAPAISSIADQTVNEDSSTSAIAFTIGDTETVSDDLILSVATSNPGLVAVESVGLGGSGANRSVVVSPIANQFGTVSITVSVSDGQLVSSESLTLTVVSQNDLPLVSNIADQSVDEDNPTSTISFSISDAETPAGSLLLTGTSSNPDLVSSESIVFGGAGGNRTLVVSPSANQFGTATITVSTSDGELVGSDSFVLNVASNNDTPTISRIGDQNTNEDTATVVIDFTIGDIETPATSLILAGSSSNVGLVPDGNIVFGGSGTARTVTITPAANQFGIAEVTVTVSDGELSAIETFSATFNAVNDPPTITTIPDQETSEDTATGSIAFTISDVETTVDSLTVGGSSSNPTLVPQLNITFGGTGANRTVVVKPAQNQFGSATVTVSVTDGDGKTSSTSFNLTVTGAIDPPTISDIADQATNEDVATGQIAFTVGDEDTSVENLTVTASSSNTDLVSNDLILIGGSGANRTVSVTPLAHQFGTVTITLTVNDGAVSTSDTFVLTVNGVNDTPTISSIADQTVDEDTATTAIGFTLGDVETPAGSLEVSASSSNTSLIPEDNIVLSGNGANRIVVVTPAANQSGLAIITITVSDGSASATEEFFVTINAVNDAPTVSAIGDQETDEDTTTAVIEFTVGDVETAANGLVISGSSSNTVLVPNSNILITGTGVDQTVQVVPVGNGFGTSTITVDVSDGSANTTESFLVTFRSVNDLPTISSIPDQTVFEDTGKGGIPFTVGDVETPGEDLIVTASSSNPFLVPNDKIVIGGSGVSRTINVTPLSDQFGTVNIGIVLIDNSGVKTLGGFSFTVKPVNDAPTVSVIPNQSINENETTGDIAFTVADVDADAESLTVTANSSNLALVPSSNVILAGVGGSRTVRVTPNENAFGTTTITVTVSDGVLTASEPFQVNVGSVNSPPSQVGLVSPANGTRFRVPFLSVIEAEATDVDGTIAKVEFFQSEPADSSQEPVKLGEDTTRPYNLEWFNNNPGTYRLTVKATDDGGASTTSQPIDVIVEQPENDLFASSTPVSGRSLKIKGSNIGATREVGETVHAGIQGNASVWWTWTAPVSGLATVSTEDSSFDTVLAVYVGNSVEALATIASDNDSGGNGTSVLVFSAEAGVDYRIAVDGVVGATGIVELSLNLNELPSVEITNPSPGAVVSFPAQILLSAQAFDNDGAVTSVEFFNKEESLGVVAQIPYTLTLNDLGVGVYEFVAKATDNEGVTVVSPKIPVTVELGRPPNDDFGNSISLSGTSLTVNGSNERATEEIQEPNHAGVNGNTSVWWNWTAPNSGQVRISTDGSAFDTMLGIYIGSSVAGLTHVASNDDGGQEVTSRVSFEAAAGTVYQIAVDGWEGDVGAISLSISLNKVPVVSLTSPQNGTTIAAPSGPPTVSLSAKSRDSDGTVVRIDFYQGETLLGSDEVSPYGFDWINVAAGDYELTARAVDDAGGVGISPSIVIQVQGAPTAPNPVVEPSNLEVAFGGLGEFRTVENGTPPFTYQWSKNGTILPDETDAILTFQNVQPSDQGRYSVRVRNDLGAGASPSAALSVILPPSITEHPKSQTVDEGTDVTLLVSVEGTAPFTYQWQQDGKSIPGATGVNYTLSNIQLANAGIYTVLVTNGARTVSSDGAIVIVKPTSGTAPTKPPFLARENFWIPDGPVNAIEQTAGKVFLGGDFRYVGPNTGGAAALALESGQVDEGFPRVNGEVRAIALDGLGGGGI